MRLFLFISNQAPTLFFFHSLFLSRQTGIRTRLQRFANVIISQSNLLSKTPRLVRSLFFSALPSDLFVECRNQMRIRTTLILVRRLSTFHTKVAATKSGSGVTAMLAYSISSMACNVPCVFLSTKWCSATVNSGSIVINSVRFVLWASLKVPHFIYTAVYKEISQGRIVCSCHDDRDNDVFVL